MTIIVLHGFADASRLAAAPMYTVTFHASEAHIGRGGGLRGRNFRGGGVAFRGLFPQAPSRTGELFFSRSVEHDPCFCSILF